MFTVADEYDYDFDHPACLKCGDKLMRFLIIRKQSGYELGVQELPTAVMEFFSQKLADDYCAEMSRESIYWYQALPLNEEK